MAEPQSPSSSIRTCRIVLIAFGVAAVLALWPIRSGAQDAGCSPFSPDTAPLRVLTDADVEHVRLELYVDPDRPPATGRAVMTLRTTDTHADSVRLVTAGASVEEVLSRDLDEMLSFRRVSTDTIVVDLSPLRDSLLVSRELISLEFTITGVAGVQFAEGFAWTIDPLLSGGAWYPWSGNPGDRFTSELLVTVPAGVLVRASGRQLAERTTEGGQTTFLFASSEPHDARAMLFAAGPFVVGSVSGSVVLHHPGSLGVTPEIIASRALRRFENGIGYPYPYGRLSVVVVPGAAPVIAGNGIVFLSDNAMGVLGSDYPIPATIEIAEGVARQWFGGVISLAEWNDEWLLSALSSYVGTLLVQETHGDVGFGVRMRELADDYRAEARSYRRPLTSSNVEHPADLRDAHARAKGVWALHSLRMHVGLDAFWQVVGLLVSWNQFGAVTTGDLGRAVEAATGIRHDGFIDRWVRAPGSPELGSSYSSARDTLFLTIEQQQIGPDVPEVYDLKLGIEVGSLAGSEHFEVQLDELRQTFALPFASEPRFVAIDPEASYLMDVTMEQSLSAWIAQLRNASTPHARQAATSALARRRGDPAVLIGLRSALIQDTDPTVKVAILRLITELSDSEAAQRAILSAQEDTSSVVRAAVLDVLSAYAGSEQVELLALEAANNDPVNAVQAAAVELLGRIESPEALSVTEAALITPSQNAVIRRAGLRVLAMLSDSAGSAGLEAAATYSQQEHPVVVRLDAVKLLSRLAPRMRQAENRLLELLEARDWQVRQAVLHALLQIGNEDAVRSHLEQEPVSWLRTHVLRLACR